MSDDDDFERYERAFHKVTIDEVWELRRAIVGPANMPPGEQGKLAKAALAALKAGKTPSPKQLAALELIVRLMRPSLLSQNRAIEELPPEASGFSDEWDGFRADVRPSLYTIGRLDNDAGRGIGTGFLVSDKILVTNTHVLEILSSGTLKLERGQAFVRFKGEWNVVPDEKAFDVVKVVAVHETLDLSLLEVDAVSLGDDRKVLRVASEPAVKGDAVVVLGYPQNDSERNPMFVSSIFANRFGVKRAAPGELIEVKASGIFHDCSTLGGNSGSPVVSLKSRQIIAVHCAGSFMFRNESVPGVGLDAFIKPHLKPSSPKPKAPPKASGAPKPPKKKKDR
jgi:S1-C subfamily serine protease